MNRFSLSIALVLSISALSFGMEKTPPYSNKRTYDTMAQPSGSAHALRNATNNYSSVTSPMRPPATLPSPSVPSTPAYPVPQSTYNARVNSDNLGSKLAVWYRCSCEKFFRSQVELVMHIKQHHRATPLGFQSSYKCGESHCAQVFDTEDQFLNHIWYHTAGKVYQCIECRQLFHELEVAQNHVKIHVQEVTTTSTTSTTSTPITTQSPQKTTIIIDEEEEEEEEMSAGIVVSLMIQLEISI